MVVCGGVRCCAVVSLCCYEGFSMVVSLQVPAGVQSHHRMRLSGRGIPRLNGYGSGDHYVHIKISIPK